MTRQENIYKDAANEKQLLEAISPEFAGQAAELDDILQMSDNPKVIAAMLFKLAKEREQTNRLLESINEKYDRIMFELKTGETKKELGEENKTRFEVLPEPDQIILEFIEKQGGATATDIRQIMNYRGLNAASQRLNKLYKEGFLKKVQSGKKVVYLAKP